MQEIEQLLKDVASKMGALREARNRFSAQLAPDFRIFDYLRTDEMGLSKCIASLLDPKGTHGQGGVFLDAFQKQIELKSAWVSTTEVCKVDTEKQANGQRRIDIYLDFHNAGIIGIENKPWAGDQDLQLSDYAAFIKKEAGNRKWLLVYLSNSDPEGNSIKIDERKMLEESGEFVRLSYADVIEWLMDCACQSKALVVRIFIEELAKFIRMNINGELDMSEESEMKNLILKSTDNIESAFHVSMAMESVKQELLKMFRNELEGMLNARGFKLVWDSSMSKEGQGKPSFGVKFSEKHDFYLRFEFGSKALDGLFWGIQHESSLINNHDLDIWSAINEKMSTQFGSGKNEKRWPWWKRIKDTSEFKDGFSHWGSSEIPWVSMKEGVLAEQIAKLADSVHKALGDCSMSVPDKSTL